jgi:hypothetical protein
MGKNIIISEEQFNKIIAKLNESDTNESNYMVKQQLFTIATLAYKMWEMLEEEDSELEDWMTSKIAQSESSIVSVVKSFMYDETTEDMRGMDKLDYNGLVIGT